MSSAPVPEPVDGRHTENATGPETAPPTVPEPVDGHHGETGHPFDELRDRDGRRDATARLTAAATRVLGENWRGTYTVPAGGLYPHQWSWDSAFIAIGLRHISPRRAQQEIESLLGAQWDDGRLPQIVFAPGRDDQYSPGPSFWHSERLSGSPAVPTAGLVQPPNHAWATLLVHEADPAESRRRLFLERAYPRLVAWHDYLRTRRAEPSGLIAAVHPWETGMDNSPAWDGPLSRVDGAFEGDIPRPDLEHAASSERPSDEEYSTYLYLAARYRDHDCDDSRESTPFRVVDPGMNALWVRSEIALARIAELLDDDAAAERHRSDARRVARAIDGLWDEELAFPVPVDALTAEALRFRSVSGLLTLLVPGSPHAEEVIGTLRGPHFGLGETAMVPSSDLTAPEFDSSQYWRGPSWFNTAWMIATALAERGRVDEARVLALDLGALALASDFAEYVDPYSGDPRGTRRFSWTAALALDLAVRYDR